MLLRHLIRQCYTQLTAGDTLVAVMCITEQSSTLILTAMLLPVPRPALERPP